MKDGEKVVNQSGGSQSFVSARFDCIPPVVLRLLAQCLGFGARRYGDENWKKIPMEDHLNHAMNHINEWRAGDRSEPHLVNAMARITFALWQAVDSGQQEVMYIHPSEVKKEINYVWGKATDKIMKQFGVPTVVLHTHQSKKPFRKVGEWCEPPIDPMQSGGGWHPGCIGYVNRPYVNASFDGGPWYHKAGEWGHPGESCPSTDGYPDQESQAKGY